MKDSDKGRELEGRYDTALFNGFLILLVEFWMTYFLVLAGLDFILPGLMLSCWYISLLRSLRLGTAMCYCRVEGAYQLI